MQAPRAYFDHNATTPLAPAVLQGMREALGSAFANASSIHQDGQQARHLVEQARRHVAALLHADPREIVFTSGGTESDNTAIFGAVAASPLSRKHVVSTTIEHPAVLHAVEHLRDTGTDVTFVPVGSSGVVDPNEIRRALQPHTVLVSVMHANNEIGTLQPLAEIGAICREAGVPFHTDGVQAAGKVPVNLETLPVDYYAVSGHKLYGPKGVGVLFARKSAPFAKFFHGGRHERDRRPGTENVPAIHGLGIAASIAAEHLESEANRLAELRNYFETQALKQIPDVLINAGNSPRLGNTSNLCFPGIEGEALVIALDLRGFAVSSGAACSSGSVEPSHVLTAIGLSRENARSCLRFSFGASNTSAHVEALLGALAESVAQLRRVAPPMRVGG